MRIAIVDDNAVFTEELKSRITTFCNDNKLSFSLKTFKDPTLMLVESTFAKFDVIFLDIEMPEINGIELANQINSLRRSDTPPYIVFVTAKDNLVFEALRQFPYSFVRKTCLQEVESCIQKICQKLIASPTYSIKEGRTMKLIELKNTIRLEKQGNYVTFYTTEGICQERSSIDEKYSDLCQYGFVRPHIGALVNAAHITEFTNTYLRLSNGTEVPVSRNYRKELRTNFEEWMVKIK